MRQGRLQAEASRREFELEAVREEKLAYTLQIQENGGALANTAGSCPDFLFLLN